MASYEYIQAEIKNVAYTISICAINFFLAKIILLFSNKVQIFQDISNGQHNAKICSKTKNIPFEFQIRTAETIDKKASRNDSRHL